MAAASDIATDAPTASIGSTISELTKLRLTTLVLATTAVGYALGRTGASTFEWGTLGWTMTGSALAAAGCAILNQVFEVRRDSMMDRTRNRPIPSGRVSRAAGFAAGVLATYAGVALLAATVNLLAAGLTLLTVFVYIFVYTPLKPITTMNTLVGAVSGAIPPMIGWAAATDGLSAGAWIIGGLLFVWQLPHFLALAWLYREDYRKGGHAMLPVIDHQGAVTAQTMVTTALLLVPIGLAATLYGITGWFSAVVCLLMGAWFGWKCLGFWRRRDSPSARAAFHASLLYLPIVLLVMVLDRGAVTPEAWLRGGGGAIVELEVVPDERR
jgi:protoheme IX farnesyltransferase